MSRVVVLSVCGFLGLGCSDALQSYPDRVNNTAVYCSQACVAARADATCLDEWDQVPESAGIEACISANCEGGFGVCEGAPGSLWDPQCYVDCVRLESAEVQNAVLEALACEVPSPECG